MSKLENLLYDILTFSCLLFLFSMPLFWFIESRTRISISLMLFGLIVILRTKKGELELL